MGEKQFRSDLGQSLIQLADQSGSELTLDDGSSVAVIGGGPAGSLFSYFALKFAQTVGIQINLDIYEPRIFSHSGPAGCNHCGGIISESLVQLLATEGVILPPNVVQRGIDSYVLHMDVGDVTIDTPLQEKRIASVYRGAGPKGLKSVQWESFDKHLLDLAVGMGAQIRRQLVNDIKRPEDRPVLMGPDGELGLYDLAVVATGVNSRLQSILEESDTSPYRAPEAVKTFICEYFLGEDTIAQYLGSAMHVFLLDIPNLEFAAIIPKGDYVTLCLLGDDIGEELVNAFLDTDQVRRCFPPGFELHRAECLCFPKLSVKGASNAFSDRLVFIGDSGVTRLYKDGIGAAYKTAKAAATTAIFQGVSEEDFRKHYWPTCEKLRTDNTLGKLVFTVSKQIQRTRFSRRGMLRMTRLEQRNGNLDRHMSTVLWDTFTGSAPYKEILFRTMKPSFVLGLCWNLLAGGLFFDLKEQKEEANGH